MQTIVSVKHRRSALNSSMGRSRHKGHMPPRATERRHTFSWAAYRSRQSLALALEDGEYFSGDEPCCFNFRNSHHRGYSPKQHTKVF